MAQRNDDELAFYLAALTNPFGQISDQERLWYLTELNIAQPYLGPTQMNDLWMAYWLSKGFAQESVNDMAYKWLLSLGIPAGHINDMWHTYFEIPAYPPILNSALAWIKPESIVQSVGSVTRLNNLGTGGTDFDLVTIAGDLTVTQSNGFNVVNYDGLSHIRPLLEQVLVQPNRIYAAYQLTDLTTQNICQVYDAMTSSVLRHKLLLDKANDRHRLETGQSIVTPNNSLTVNVEVTSALFNGATSDLLVAPNIVASGNVGTQNFEYVTLGGRYPGLEGSDMLGTINEFIVFNGVLPDAAEDAEIFNHLRQKWGSS